MSSLIVVKVMQGPPAHIPTALKYFWLGLPPELWVMIVGRLPLRDAAAGFSLTCRAGLDVFLSAAHWKDRWRRLGRIGEANADPRAAFRAAIQDSLVLWVDRSRKTGEFLESHLGCPERKGMFPVLRLGPLGHTHPHDFILGSVLAVSHIQLLPRPHEFRLTETAKPKQMMRAMLVVGSRLGIKLTKIPFIFNNNRFGQPVEFLGWDSIDIHSRAWGEFMGVPRTACKEIDRTLGMVLVPPKKL